MGGRRKAGAVDAPIAEQPSANAERGEHSLSLAGVTYRLRPSHSAIVAIEAATQQSALQLVTLGNAGALTLAQIGAIAAGLIRAGAAPTDTMTQRVDAERIGELAFEEGATAVIPRLTLCLLDAVTGGRDAAGNAKAATA